MPMQEPISDIFAPVPRLNSHEFEPHDLAPAETDALTSLRTQAQILQAQAKLREFGPVIDRFANDREGLGEQAIRIDTLAARLRRVEPDHGDHG